MITATTRRRKGKSELRGQGMSESGAVLCSRACASCRSLEISHVSCPVCACHQVARRKNRIKLEPNTSDLILTRLSLRSFLELPKVVVSDATLQKRASPEPSSLPPTLTRLRFRQSQTGVPQRVRPIRLGM